MYKVYCDSYLIYDPEIPNYAVAEAKLELELNKTGSFNFTIYPDHPNFDKLKKLKSIITVYQGDKLIFRGRILNDEQGFYNEKQVSCEGELAFLLDSIQRPYDFFSGDNHTTIAELFTFFIERHNSQVILDDFRFEVGNITVTDPNNYIVRADSTYMNTWDSINKKLIEINGGYLWVRHEADGNYIDYLSDFDTVSNQTIEFGKNLLNLEQITKGEDIATAIIPLGAKLDENSTERVTIDSVNEGFDYVFDTLAVQKYGWIFRTVTFDDVTEPSNLLTKANKYLAEKINLIVSIELTAFDLSALDSDVNSFHIGTYIRVSSSPHSLNSTFLVRKLSLDLLNPQSDKLTIGTAYSTFTEQTSDSKSNYQGTVQKVEEIENKYSTLQADVLDQVSSVINQNSTEIMQQVSEDYYLKDDANTLIESVNTRFSQTNDEFEFRFNEFKQDVNDVAAGADAKFQQISKYIRFVDGNIVLGEEGNELTLKIENDKISFLENGAEIAYWQNRKFYAVDGEFINSLQLGNFAFIPRANGNLSFKKVVT